MAYQNVGQLWRTMLSSSSSNDWGSSSSNDWGSSSCAKGNKSESEIGVVRLRRMRGNKKSRKIREGIWGDFWNWENDGIN
ncbi:putative 28S ribosomal protein S31, mitochondrial [Sesbania bispinosa]|nr:putative 28S ribosomal protein S31, mitochondrial [Sesbania bispinosa]